MILFDPHKEIEYRQEYWDKYQAYRGTEMSQKLNLARCALTEKYCKSLLDIGIGNGSFIENFTGEIYGYDVNPYAIRWLEQRNLFKIPGEVEVEGYCFWDVLEHIVQPLPLLKKLSGYVFISIPIFHSYSHLMGSKHYRPGEHFWYFDDEGLIQFMKFMGFEYVEDNDKETEVGREDIWSYVFYK